MISKSIRVMYVLLIVLKQRDVRNAIVIQILRNPLHNKTFKLTAADNG